jgi:hypothetical protein
MQITPPIFHVGVLPDLQHRLTKIQEHCLPADRDRLARMSPAECAVVAFVADIDVGPVHIEQPDHAPAEILTLPDTVDADRGAPELHDNTVRELDIGKAPYLVALNHNLGAPHDTTIPGAPSRSVLPDQVPLGLGLAVRIAAPCTCVMSPVPHAFVTTLGDKVLEAQGTFPMCARSCPLLFSVDQHITTLAWGPCGGRPPPGGPRYSPPGQEWTRKS